VSWIRLTTIAEAPRTNIHCGDPRPSEGTAAQACWRRAHGEPAGPPPPADMACRTPLPGAMCPGEPGSSPRNSFHSLNAAGLATPISMSWNNRQRSSWGWRGPLGKCSDARYGSAPHAELSRITCHGRLRVGTTKAVFRIACLRTVPAALGEALAAAALYELVAIVSCNSRETGKPACLTSLVI
jgi:hypothetical protein